MKKTIENYCHELKSEVDAQLLFIRTEQNTDEGIAKESCNYLIKINQRLKEYLSRYHFHNHREEILFFKILKPQLFWQLIYHNQVYKIEKCIPDGGHKAIKAYYKIELAKIMEYFNENKDFYRYYRTNNVSLDSFYFKRGNHDIAFMGDCFAFEFDEQYSTPYSFKISKILANERIVEYLEEKIKALDQNIEFHSRKNGQSLPMQWSLSKAALVELIYALEGVSAFNEGKIQIKTIAYNFGLLFNTEIGDPYRIFAQIRDRKLSGSKFIDRLKEAFVRRLEEND